MPCPADRRSRTAARARGRLRWGPSRLPLARPARPAPTPALPPPPASRRALLARQARTPPRPPLPPSRRVKRAPPGSFARPLLQPQRRVLSERFCPQSALPRSTTAGLARWVRTARATPPRRRRFARLVVTLNPPARPVLLHALNVLRARTALRMARRGLLCALLARSATRPVPSPPAPVPKEPSRPPSAPTPLQPVSRAL